MKILIISQEFPPVVGGAGIVAAQNARVLAEKGHDVTVVARGQGIKQEYGYHFINVRGRGLKQGKGRLWILHMLFVLKRLHLDSYDSIILNDIGAAFVFISLLKKKKLFPKTSYYLHGDEVKNVIKNQRGYLKVFDFKKSLLDFIFCCKNVVAVSDYMKKYFINSVDKILPEEKFSTVYAGVDSKEFFPVESKLFDKYKVEGYTVMLSVSRIIKEKGYSKKLEVFKMALGEGHKLHWVVVGEGSYLNELKAKVEEYNLNKHISFVGEVPRAQLKFYYSCADIFWLLSEREDESFGLVYLEAQLCGCPTVGYATYGVVEAIQDGITGFFLKNPEEFLSFLEVENISSLDREVIARESKKMSLETQIDHLLRIL